MNSRYILKHSRTNNNFNKYVKVIKSNGTSHIGLSGGDLFSIIMGAQIRFTGLPRLYSNNFKTNSIYI